MVIALDNTKLRRHLFESFPQLSQNALSVALAVAENRDEATGGCHPTKNLLVAMSRGSKTQFRRAINELSRLEIMHRVNGTGASGVTSCYWFPFDQEKPSINVKSSTPNTRAKSKRSTSICDRCGTRPDVIHRHHVLPVASGVEDSRECNIVRMCVDCHRWVHGAENVDGLYVACRV